MSNRLPHAEVAMDVRPIKRTRSLRQKLVGGITVALMAFLALEGVLRVVIPADTARRFEQINQIVIFLGTQKSELMLDFDSQRFWKLKPNIQIEDPQNTFWQGTVSNSLGFRSPEFPLARSPNTLRVVCFGDSSTFGIGSRMEDTWPSQLKQLLNDDLRPGSVLPAAKSEDSVYSRVEVINAGVPGYSSYQGLQHMLQQLDRLQPDVVFASYANNDFWHWDQKTDAEHAATLSGSGVRNVVFQSRIVQLIAGLHDRFSSSSLHSESVALPSPNQHWAMAATMNYVSPVDEWARRVPIDSFRDNLEQMADLCRNRGVVFVPVKWPDQPQASGEWSPRIEYQDVIDEIAVARGLQVADVVAMFQKNSWAQDTYIPNDIVHVNKDGNQLAATAARNAIRRALRSDSLLTN